MCPLIFPDGFTWGVATSAQQIEGAVGQDGRGESIWDRFAAGPGNIEDGTVPTVACDSYHRWRDDIKLMRDMGLNAYRFSVAWPRIQPTGQGPANAAGLDYYDALVDGLLEAGLEPFPTLYHWDLPQALQDRGGWTSRETAARLADYAALVVARLGDRVKRWVTLNEPWCAAHLGHQEGCHAPGLKNPMAALTAAHHLLLGHGLAAGVIRDTAPAAEVGIVNIMCPAEGRTGAAADLDAARWFDGFFNRWYMDPLFTGNYPQDVVADRVAAGDLPGPELSFVRPGDMELVAAPLDFLGINYYSRSVMEAGPDGQPRAHLPVPEEERTDMGWEVYPEGLRRGLLNVLRRYNPARIYIMENGAAYDDPALPDGSIPDPRRVDYLRGHLTALHQAMAEGVPVAGYFCWSLMDNFEWGLGFAKKFGLHAVEEGTLRRIPRDSARWYARVARANAVEDQEA